MTTLNFHERCDLLDVGDDVTIDIVEFGPEGPWTSSVAEVNDDEILLRGTPGNTDDYWTLRDAGADEGGGFNPYTMSASRDGRILFDRDGRPGSAPGRLITEITDEVANNLAPGDFVTWRFSYANDNDAPEARTLTDNPGGRGVTKFRGLVLSAQEDQHGTYLRDIGGDLNVDIVSVIKAADRDEADATFEWERRLIRAAKSNRTPQVGRRGDIDPSQFREGDFVRAAYNWHGEDTHDDIYEGHLEASHSSSVLSVDGWAFVAADAGPTLWGTVVEVLEHRLAEAEGAITPAEQASSESEPAPSGPSSYLEAVKMLQVGDRVWFNHDLPHATHWPSRLAGTVSTAGTFTVAVDVDEPVRTNYYLMIEDEPADSVKYDDIYAERDNVTLFHYIDGESAGGPTTDGGGEAKTAEAVKTTEEELAELKAWRDQLIIDAQDEADKQGYCSDFDDFMEAHGLPRRSQRTVVTATVMVPIRMQVSLSRADAPRRSGEFRTMLLAALRSKVPTVETMPAYGESLSFEIAPEAKTMEIIDFNRTRATS